jgi:uncharacterized protein YbjT (DUF2867 family)
MILVTGATGTLGSEVVKQLSAKDVSFRTIVRSMSKAGEIKALGGEAVESDYTKPETLKKAFKGIRKLFLLTPLVPNAPEMTANLVDAAKKAGIKHIVKQSGLGADDKAATSLGNFHRQAEKIVETSGIPYTFLRPNSFMQNFLARPIRSEGAFYLPCGNGKVSYVDVRDIAAVAVTALTEDGYEGKIYNITGPKALSHYEIATIFSDVLHRKVNYVDVPPVDVRQAMASRGMSEWLIDVVLGLYSFQRADLAAEVSDAVERVTGKTPISFAQFAKDYATIFK